jgi:hypothetical protein
MKTFFFVLCLALTAQEQPPTLSEKLRAGLKLPDKEEANKLAKEGAAHKKVVDFFMNSQNWIKTAQKIDDRTGAFPKSYSVTLVFKSLDRFGVGTYSSKNEGEVAIDVSRCAGYLAEMEKNLKDKRFAHVPKESYMTLENLLTHELTHTMIPCSVDWFMEGVADYAAQEKSHFYNFHWSNYEIKPIDQCPVDGLSEYTLGHLFFEYLEATCGREKVKSIIARTMEQWEKPDISGIVAEVTGKPWEEIVKSEFEWAKKFLKKYK